jgi:quercetin dioxygenase-like cupin family protein
VAETIFGNPYIDSVLNSTTIERSFSLDREDAEYVWHTDQELREVEILNGEGWQFQYENCLPWLIEKGMVFYIPLGESHRLIKGKTTLHCRIIKHAK